jgi:hypothetical protein
MLIKFLDGTKRGVEIKPDANLRGADLRGADLHGADLRYADLRHAYLCSANLSGADLSHADLSYADLYGAELRGADLRRADLSSANLSGAYLSGADLRRANLSSADLSSADLSGAKGLAAFKVCPEVGQFIGFKKVNGVIITLMIPADAKRVNAYSSRKCRAEFAYVLHVDMRDYKGHRCLEAHNDFVYPTSGLVTPDSFDPDPRVECSHGIHLFMTRAEALEY